MNNTYKELTKNFIENRTEKSFTPLYNKLYKSLTVYIGKQTKNAEMTDDIVANSLLKVWKNIDQYDETKGAITSWVYRIAQNEMYAQFNKGRNTVSMSLLEEKGGEVDGDGGFNLTSNYMNEVEEVKTEQDHWEEYNETMSTLGRSMEVINSLDPMFKDFIYDRLVNKMKYQDIAEKYDVDLQTVKNRIFHSKKKIQKALSK